MKEIFDWLREQIGTKKGDAETRMYRLIDEDRGDRCVYSETDIEEFSVNTWADALSILDEAEAKWEADCKRADFEYRINDVLPMLEEKCLYGTASLIKAMADALGIKISEVE